MTRGSGRSVVVDPGPPIPSHVEAILSACPGGDRRGRADPSAPRPFRGRGGARRPGRGAAYGPLIRSFGWVRPGWRTVTCSGCPGGSVAVLATPGHTSDSRSLLLTGADGVVRLLTGDMVLGQGTTVITHPDGNLGAYLESLARLQRLVTERGVAEILPGHGPVVTDPAGVAGLLPRTSPGATGSGAGGAGRWRAYAGRGRRPGVRRGRSPGVAGRGAIRTRATGLSRTAEDSGGSDSGTQLTHREPSHRSCHEH